MRGLRRLSLTTGEGYLGVAFWYVTAVFIFLASILTCGPLALLASRPLSSQSQDQLEEGVVEDGNREESNA